MLICFGRHVTVQTARFFFEAPDRYGLLHDSSGRYWPRNSLVIMPFRQGTETSHADEGEDFYGEVAHIRVGGARMPPHALDRWEYLGIATKIFYQRAGKHEGYYEHTFGEPHGTFRIAFLFKRAPRVRVYGRGYMMRLQLGQGSIVDDRGIVWP